MGKYSFDWNENDYKTPPILYEKALKHWEIDIFDLDTCCTDENIPAREYCKKGQKDGLLTDWANFNWCNPPFNECRKWIAKAYHESIKGHKTAMLIPARTETAYWHDYILKNDDVKIEWLRKGYKFFNRDNEEMGVFKNALAIVYFEGIKQTTKYDLLKTLSARDFAYVVAVDNVGDCRGVCTICQRHFDGNCDDKCVAGIIEFLESGAEE